MKLVLTPEESIRLTDAALAVAGARADDVRHLESEPAAYRLSAVVVDLPGFDRTVVPVEVSRA